MQRKLKQQDPVSIQKFKGDVEILFDRNLLSFILNELAKYPSVEEGGKYIGYLFQPDDPSIDKLRVHPNAQTIVVTDFLPSGPKAVRTRDRLMPDGEYQEALFRKAEQLDSEIEHVGTWHSHHCNGLQTLSTGDIDGYFRTVNKPHYRPDFFVTSLVKRIPHNPEEPDWIDHFLFVEGVEEYYLVTDHIRVIDWPTIFAAHIGHSVEHESNTPTVPTENIGEPEQLCDLWHETNEGRRILAEDKRFFDKQFGPRVVATRRNSRITITGRMGCKAIAVSYPRKPTDDNISISLQEHSSTILHIDCNLSHREVGFTAALAALAAS